MRRSFCQASAREARQISVLGKWWRSLYWAKFSGQALQCLSMGLSPSLQLKLQEPVTGPFIVTGLGGLL